MLQQTNIESEIYNTIQYNTIQYNTILFNVESLKSGCPVSRDRGSCLKFLTWFLVQANSFYKPRNLTTFCRAVYTFVKTALQKMQEEHLWMRHMAYNICIQCPVCSKGGVRVSVCDIHYVAGCKRDQCLHYISEEKLVGDTYPLVCSLSRDAMNTVISKEQFTPWFEALDSKVCATFLLKLLCLYVITYQP